MGTGRVVRGEVDDAREKLIQEGAASYPEAVIALREFQRVVQEKCEEVVANRLSDLSNATGVKFEENQIWKYPRPGQHTLSTWDGTSVWLYAGLTLADIGYMYFGACWVYKQSGERELNAAAIVGFRKRDQYAKALAQFKKTNGPEIQVYAQLREISFFDPIPLKEASSLPERLDGLIDKLLEAWRQAGGVKAIA